MTVQFAHRHGSESVPWLKAGLVGRFKVCNFTPYHTKIMPKKVTNTMIADAPEVIAYGLMNGDFVSYLAMSLSMYQGSAMKCINARWNCPGGSVGDGVAAYNSFKNSKTQVHVYVDGVAASMGYYSILGAGKIFISKFGRVMLHEAKGGNGGTAEEMRSDADEVDAANDTLIAMVCERTGMTAEKARETFFNGRDNWYSAKEALSMGLVDCIYDLDEVDMPEAASNLEVYAMVQSSFNQTKNTVMQGNNMTPEALAELGLTASATPEQIQAAQHSRISLLNQQLKDQKDSVNKDKVNALLDQALNVDKKITAEFKVVLLAQYETNPEGLSAILDKMPGFQSVTGALNMQSVKREGAAGVYSPQVEAYMRKGWDALDKSGEMVRLHALDKNAYEELYKGKFGYAPNTRPVDMGRVMQDVARAKAEGNVVQP